ncbi:hypothetical protein CC78DRAFT_541886 [Lojkania enalia]|uniref:Uncharacterized protein n=1 Tax=Lojkania enalia TaxID=147567 RepID=A0A9P4KIQ1_9PLEO|nr:hypothetical protein CC78DRAFT_541886 [Didymosphaeria enalia]
MAGSGRPDLIISIDFGMTCMKLQNSSIHADLILRKVPTALDIYKGGRAGCMPMKTRHSSVPSSWGFLAETAQEQGSAGDESREWFKILLDEHLLEQARKNHSDPSKVPSITDVEKWYCDYFQLLYRSIEARLRSELASSWEDAKIEFIFSVPTTWRPNPTVERFRNIINRAGFTRSSNHRAVIGLTEAEAAAVHTARNMPGIFKDLSVFRVRNTTSFGASMTLEQIDVVFGSTIGAARLDSLFEKFILDRLEAANRMAPLGLLNLNQTAWEMRVGKEYQNAKCDYGSEESFSDTETFSIRVPKLDRSYVNAEHGISGGDMHFRRYLARHRRHMERLIRFRDDLKTFFDMQIAKLFDMIEKQLVRLQQSFPNEQVSHMVLSGGLGNSAYVRDCLRNRYAFGNAPYPNAQSIQIRVAPEPQLVVCKGNVADRVEKLKSGQSVLGWRRCRSSYGTLCKMMYNPNNPQHIGLRVEMDPFDGKQYVVDYIDWFIKKGEPVSSDYPVVKNFQRKCSPATSLMPDPPRVFPTEIISSDVDKNMLPIVMNSLCRSVCKVESDFSSLPLSMFKLKNRHWWNTGKKYHRVDFCVKVNMGPADISFELWHQGVKVSKDNSIKVEWYAAPPPPPSELASTDLPMNSLSASQGPGTMNGRVGKHPNIMVTNAPYGTANGGYGMPNNW